MKNRVSRWPVVVPSFKIGLPLSIKPTKEENRLHITCIVSLLVRVIGISCHTQSNDNFAWYGKTTLHVLHINFNARYCNYHPTAPRIEVKERGKLHLYTTSVTSWHVIGPRVCNPVTNRCLGSPRRAMWAVCLLQHRDELDVGYGFGFIECYIRWRALITGY
jgi:hypothetical protein